MEHHFNQGYFCRLEREQEMETLTRENEIVLSMIRKRRSIRQFTAEDVSQEQIETLLEIAMCAPNRLDRRPWHFVVIRDRALQKQLADLLRVYPYLEMAPVVIAVCALPSISSTWLLDTSAAIENMMIAATAMGLGTTWVGNPDDPQWSLVENKLISALAIPRDDMGIVEKLLRRWERFRWGKNTTDLKPAIRISALVAVGHPAKEPPPHGRHDRFDAGKVHYGCW
jgi:nitroreductase